MVGKAQYEKLYLFLIFNSNYIRYTSRDYFMQEFYIKKGSMLPELHMELVQDGRHDFNKFYEAIQNSEVTFTMKNKDSGVIRIANAPALVLEKMNTSCVIEYYLCYKWKERDTKYPGTYIGEFNINFLDGLYSEGKQYPTGKLLVPIREELTIFIL